MNRIERDTELLAEKIDCYFQSKPAHLMIGSLVILVAVITGLSSYPEIKAEYGTLFHYVGLAIITIFVTEISSRIIITKSLFFKNYWNIFDFVIIAASILPLGDDYTALRILRLLTSFNLLKIFPKTRLVIDGFLRSLPGLLNVIFLEFVFLYTFSIMATSFYGHLLPDAFGNVGRSMYSLFSMNGNLDWLAFFQPYEKVVPNLWIFLLIYVIIAGFILMNFVVGTIIDAMNEAASAEQREQGVHELDNRFSHLSKELEEIKKLLHSKK